METSYRYFVKIKKSSGEIVDGFSCKQDDFSEDLVQDTDHFSWIEYDQEREEVEEDSVVKTLWWAVIDGKRICKLDDFNRGSILFLEDMKVLPAFDFGELDPSLFVYDDDLSEWKPPTFENNSIQVWDTLSKIHIEKTDE